MPVMIIIISKKAKGN